MTIYNTWSYEVEDGLTLRGVDHRLNGHPTLQFIHGIAFASKIYLPMLSPLNESYGLFLQDLQGHGESDLGDHYPGWQKSIDRIALVMDEYDLHTRLNPIVGMGHSYGASLQMILAAQQPERFSAMILLDPMILPQPMFEMFENIDTNPMVDRIKKKTARWNSREEAQSYLCSKTAFKNWHDDAINAFIDHAMVVKQDSYHLRCPPEFEVEVLTKPLVTLWDAIPQIKTPTIILHSDEPVSPIRQTCQQVAEMNPNIESIPMPGSHNFMLEYPKETCEQIIFSLDKLGV